MGMEQLQVEQEETSQYLTAWNIARNSFIQYGKIDESLIPLADRLEFRKMLLNYFEGKIEIGEQLAEEIESSIAFYRV